MITDFLLKITDRCNLDCNYCYLFDKNNNDMAIETVDNISMFMKYYTVMNYGYIFKIHLSGGEPTLIDINSLNYIVKSLSSPSINLNLNTNGVNFTSEHAKICLDNNIHVTLSIDGNKEIHDLQRSNSFDKVMKALKLMREYNLSIGFIGVITDMSIDYKESILKFYKDNNITNIKLNNASGLISYSDYVDFLLYLKDNMIECNTQTLKENKVQYYGNTLCCSYSTCCSDFLSINQDGDVTTCERFFGLKNKEDYIFANINDTQFNDIVWNSKRFNIIRTIYERKSKCVNCNSYRLCGNGCYHSYLINNEKICDGRKKLIEVS